MMVLVIGAGGAITGAHADTARIFLDRDVYPVPFGDGGDTGFRLHEYAPGDEYLDRGDLIVHITLKDTGFAANPSSKDQIAVDGPAPLNVSILRGSDSAHVGFAGNTTVPVTESGPDSASFVHSIAISYNQGPAEGCPSAFNDEPGCILKGDILKVDYANPGSTSGEPSSVTSSATFDLRDAYLQTHQSIYIIESYMIFTIIDSDLNLDSEAVETYSLDLIGWDSDPATLSMGDLGGSKASFDPEPSYLRETGDNTGIFQTIITMPAELEGNRLRLGEQINIVYTDSGPSAADYVGGAHEELNETVFTSNFGALVELSQEEYTWTDKVYITIVAPDHNPDDRRVDEIGGTDFDPIRISTGNGEINNYRMVETGPDTGIFTGEITLTGFEHDADGDGTTEFDNPRISGDGAGPIDGLLPAGNNDELTISYEFSAGETVVASAPIRWNMGDIHWSDTIYYAGDEVIIKVNDPDMNLDPDDSDVFTVNVWSDSDTDGINARVFETDVATGIFGGVIGFNMDKESSRYRLHVSENDTIYAEYKDNTLPDPHTTSDELGITVTSLFGGPERPHPHIELYKTPYTWTDKVYITITSPDHNLDDSVIEEIGGGNSGQIRIETNDATIESYRLVEDEADSGIFAGEIILAGSFDNINGIAPAEASGTGPTDGRLTAAPGDELNIFFEWGDNKHVHVKEDIEWSTAYVQWLKPSYPANGGSTVRIFEPDMNFNQEKEDIITINVQSDSDAKGIDISAIETNIDTGIFEGVVWFVTDSESSIHRLNVAEGDTVTAVYKDITIPSQYFQSEDLITAETVIEMPAPERQQATEEVDITPEAEPSVGEAEITDTETITDPAAGEAKTDGTVSDSEPIVEETEITDTTPDPEPAVDEAETTDVETATDPAVDEAETDPEPVADESETTDVETATDPAVDEAETTETDPEPVADESETTDTDTAGTSVPHLDRIGISNMKIADSLDRRLDAVSTGQQVQITADLTNGHDSGQAFTYIVHIQDETGITVSVSWISGSMSPGQSVNPALSWTPEEAGTYSVTAFAWESVSSPTALSLPVTTSVTVN